MIGENHSGLPLAAGFERLRAQGRDPLRVAAKHEQLVDNVRQAMLARFVEKYAEWGDSHETPDYSDDLVVGAIARAEADLQKALITARGIGWANGLPEIRKRAADLINQTLFLADPTRLAMTSTERDLIRPTAPESDEAPD